MHRMNTAAYTGPSATRGWRLLGAWDLRLAGTGDCAVRVRTPACALGVGRSSAQDEHQHAARGPSARLASAGVKTRPVS